MLEKRSRPPASLRRDTIRVRLARFPATATVRELTAGGIAGVGELEVVGATVSGRSRDGVCSAANLVAGLERIGVDIRSVSVERARV